MEPYEKMGISEREYKLAHSFIRDKHKKTIYTLSPFFDISPAEVSLADIKLRPLLMPGMDMDQGKGFIYIPSEAEDIGWSATVTKYRNWQLRAWHEVAHETAHYLDIISGQVQRRERLLDEEICLGITEAIAELCALYSSGTERILPRLKGFLDEQSPIYNFFKNRKHRSKERVERLILALVRIKSLDDLAEDHKDVLRFLKSI